MRVRPAAATFPNRRFRVVPIERRFDMQHSRSIATRGCTVAIVELALFVLSITDF